MLPLPFQSRIRLKLAINDENEKKINFYSTIVFLQKLKKLIE